MRHSYNIKILAATNYVCLIVCLPGFVTNCFPLCAWLFLCLQIPVDRDTLLWLALCLAICYLYLICALACSQS